MDVDAHRYSLHTSTPPPVRLSKDCVLMDRRGRGKAEVREMAEG